MRFIGLDAHKTFCEVAIAEDGEVRSRGRIMTTPAELELFAQSLGKDDRVALETSSVAGEIARILEPHVAEVLVVSASKLRAISEARAKTDRLDARALAALLAQGYLTGIWLPDERTRALRRRVARRAGFVKQSTRHKNAVHAVLHRTLKGPAPCSDLFGKRGRAWLSTLELPEEEREALESELRQLDFVTTEIELLDRELAKTALTWPEIRRLMTITGVSIGAASALVAAIGDIRRFPSPRKLVSYLGLDPRVRQSGDEPARHGRISKRGNRHARHMLGEAAITAMQTPGPLRAFGERTRARRGPQIAAVAVARKIATVSWHLLVRGEDYAFGRPSTIRKKLRQLELDAGAPRQRGKPLDRNTRRRLDAKRELELMTQAESAYRELTRHWQPKPRSGAGATPGRAS